MAVLVTGGAGFVGSHLVDRLIADGKHVIIFDNLVTGRLANVERALGSGAATFVFADVATSAAELGRLWNGATKESCSGVYHLASPASPESYGAHPWETLAVNGQGTMALCEFAIARSAPLLFASTSEIYGDPLEHPQRETYFGNVNSIGPRACYDEGKRFGEAAVSVAVRERGLDGKIVRIFNCYGPRMDLADGRLIPALLTAAAAGKPFPIHGDGSQTRSMTFVRDLVEGLVRVAAMPRGDLWPVNLGGEDERSVREIAECLARIASLPLECEHLALRPEDPQRRKPNIERARSLSWTAKTTLEDGLRETYDWSLEATASFV